MSAQELFRLSLKDGHNRSKTCINHCSYDSTQTSCPCKGDDCKHFHRLETKEDLQREEEHGDCFPCRLVGLSDGDSEVKAWSWEELRAAQQEDLDLKLLLQWKESDNIITLLGRQLHLTVRQQKHTGCSGRV